MKGYFVSNRQLSIFKLLLSILSNLSNLYANLYAIRLHVFKDSEASEVPENQSNKKLLS